jgi:hypothetical protein
MIANLPLPIHEPPERISRTCALGLRFLDEATGRPVSGDSFDLEAEAWPLGASNRKTTGILTPSGIMAFHGLSGLREFENSDANDPFESAPQHVFQVAVRDRAGQLLPCTFVVSAPKRGVAAFAGDGSPPWIAEGAVPLFSAPSRPAPAGLGVIRAELHYHASGQPAAWAFVEASYSSGGTRRTARGLADRQGRVIVMFAYPEGRRRAFNSSPPGDSRGISQQEWTVDLTIFHDRSVPAEAAADYDVRWVQPATSAMKGGASPPRSVGPQTLQFGRELDLGIVELEPA